MKNVLVINMGLKSIRSIIFNQNGLKLGSSSLAKADVLGKDVLVLSEFETTASGAAMMVLTGQNIYPDMKSASDKFATVRMIIKPNMENNKKYMYMYELYKESYKALKPLFKKRKELIDKLSNDKEIQIENL